MYIEGLDRIDNQILEILKTDGRMSYSDIGEKIEISRTAVKNHMDAMEENGYITGYSVQLSKKANKNVINFYIDIESQPKFYEYVVSVLANQKYIKTIADVAGDCHIIASGSAPNMQELDEMNTKLHRIFNGLHRYSLSIVSSIIKDVDGGIEYAGASQEECIENARRTNKEHKQ